MAFRYITIIVAICIAVAPQTSDAQNISAVIDEAVRQVRGKCILSSDYYFLRRVIEAQRTTLVNSHYGGIAKVLPVQVTEVQRVCQQALSPSCDIALNELNVDLKSITSNDLNKPVVSVLVMAVYIESLNKTIPVGITNQATFYLQILNGSQSVFTNVSRQLDSINECAGATIDLAFVIDESGSVGSSNFDKTKDFLINIVNELDIGPSQTRIAVVSYASRATIDFGFNSYSTKSDVINAIRNISYSGGGTATYTALDVARLQVFNQARPSAAKVTVLVTDGWSSKSLTIAAADRLKNDTVTIFAIGVVNPNPSELLGSASDPSCTHYIELKDYNEIGFIVREIQSESCKVPAVITNCSDILYNTIPGDEQAKQQVLEVSCGNNDTQITLQITVVCGNVTIYVGLNNTYPNSANYDIKEIATADSAATVYINKTTIADKVFVTLYSKRVSCNDSTYNITIQPNNTGVCQKGHVFDSLSKLCMWNPCTPYAIALHRFYHVYPYSKKFFIQCDQFGGIWVMPCPLGTVWNQLALTCDHALPVKRCYRNGPQYFPHPTNPNKFYQCTGGLAPIEMSCPATLVWKQAFLRCDYP